MNYKKDSYRYVWDSPDAFLSDVLEVSEPSKRHDAGWVGETYDQTLERTTSGNLNLIPKAEALLSKIEVDLDNHSPEWGHSVAGSYPDIPAFLSGDPECMMTRIMRPSEKAPIRVFVCTTSSASIDAQTLLARGIAALALVMQLVKQGRPIELWTFTQLCGNAKHDGNTCLMVRMPTAPIDMARIAHCLSACSFDRTLAMAFGYAKTGFEGQWAQERDVRKLVNAGPSDIVLNEARYEDDLVRTPVLWIQRELAKLNEE